MVAHMDQQKKLRCNNQILKLPDSKSILFPSIVQAPIMELKTLLEQLKYAFLREAETAPFIISNKLSKKVESKLIGILRKYKNTIGWTIANITGLSPSLCMHKILMEKILSPHEKPN